jgi:hypothetical protein
MRAASARVMRLMFAKRASGNAAPVRRQGHGDLWVHPAFGFRSRAEQWSALPSASPLSDSPDRDPRSSRETRAGHPSRAIFREDRPSLGPLAADEDRNAGLDDAPFSRAIADGESAEDVGVLELDRRDDAPFGSRVWSRRAFRPVRLHTAQ